MTEPATRAIAVVGVSAILPDAPDAATFWANVTSGRYSISDVPAERWDPARYFDPDPKATDKTYSKIGGWVRDWVWDPFGWRLPIPPKVGEAMDDAQRWAIACTRAALIDAGWPERPIDGERTAVILGNALSGEKHYLTNLRVVFPEIGRYLADAPSFQGLPADVRRQILAEAWKAMDADLPIINEDTMPGELGNCMAGRVANLFDLHGPNFVTDAACASALAALDAAVTGLASHTFDVAITGGIDRNMGASSFVKFCKIGALSATGTRPFDAGADGFVMGEGAVTFVLKRLADAEAAGDRIYAVIRGVGGASDGKGKGITAPNPSGQRYAIERAWRAAGVSPSALGLLEAHGTSTRVGDVVEVSSAREAFVGADLPAGAIALGSVKSNIGHLKAAAGAAGLLKAALSLHHEVLPPSLGVEQLNPNVEWDDSPLRVNTELRPWETSGVRTAAVSAFGFGGTNFHVVLEEHVPGRLRDEDAPKTFAVGAPDARTSAADLAAPASVALTDVPAPAAADETARATADVTAPAAPAAPLRGALLLGADDAAGLAAQLRDVIEDAAAGTAPPPARPAAEVLARPERLAIDYGDAAELADKARRALTALETDARPAWKVLQGKGVFRGSGRPGKVAFLYTGQGSQYANMLRSLRDTEPLVAEVFADADRVMTPLLGHPLSDVIFPDPGDPDAVAAAEEALRRTEITQPAVLAVDLALTRLLDAYGVRADMVMGHSLGEYGALQAAGCLTFAAALEAVSARGQEMAHLSTDDPGAMVAVFAPLETVQEIVAATPGNVVVANVNSTVQSVIGGATEPVLAAEQVCKERGFVTARLPVSHAFHTSIVAPASEPLRAALRRLDLRPPELPIVANVTGDFYPMGDPGTVVPQMLDLLAAQVASPVQFVDGLHRLHEAGATVFVEVGPKWALRGFVKEVLGDSCVALATNHPKNGDIVSFNHALCGLWAAGVGAPAPEAASATLVAAPAVTAAPVAEAPVTEAPAARAVEAPVARAVEPAVVPVVVPAAAPATTAAAAGGLDALQRLFDDFVAQGRQVLAAEVAQRPRPYAPVVITGAALGTPGTERIFDDANLGRLLGGAQLIGPIPDAIRQQIAARRITRLVKDDGGGGRFETIDDAADVIKLAARPGELDLAAEFGLDADRVAAFGGSTRLAIGAGIDALRDAGIPMVRRYKTTRIGSQLPDRWALPDALRDDTGIIFASAFPGADEFAAELTAFGEDRARRERLAELERLRDDIADPAARAALDARIATVRAEVEANAYTFDRRFLFRVLSMGHSQFADVVGARGPNTQINAACASTTQAVALAEDWIREGRCRRVVVVAADDVTGDDLLAWIGAGFLATGAAATDDDVAEAALPFDRRRHGMLLGMGAAAIVVESAEAARERGVQPICEVLAAESANSAFHGTRLDVDHIGGLMEQVITAAERRAQLDRREIAPSTVFVSHETYTPARGGSAAAEIFALRRVFGDNADKIVIANTKGFTGHPMGVGLEDVVAIKTLETGIVPPVANHRDIDPDLGPLHLSEGGPHDVRYALRLAAGFGSQIAMMLLRWTPMPDGRRRSPDDLGFRTRLVDPERFAGWLRSVSGDPSAELEVVQRTLRVVDRGPASAAPVPAADATSAAVPATAPAMEAPAVEAPAVETPAVETPAVEAPAVEAHPNGSAAVSATPAPETDNQRAETPAEASPAVSATPAPKTDDERAETGLEATIVALVAEQTGYPPELLGLDLDLEADLGIDTVKQAELFATIRTTYDIPRDDTLKLRDYPTLAHVLGFVRECRPSTSPAPAPEAPAATAPVVEAVPAQDVSASTVPETATPRAETAAVDAEEIGHQIVALVAEQTGYPADMLDLDLDLEADLGIDTVKQAELFATIRTTYDIPRDDTLKLRDYPTLRHVLGFVTDRTPTPTDSGSTTPATETEPTETAAAPADTAAAPAAVEAPADTAPAAVDAEEIGHQIVALVAEQTGYPADMLDLDLDLEADLGIDTVKQAELFATIRTTYDIPRDDTLKLRDYPTLRHVLGFVTDRTPTPTDSGSTTPATETEPTETAAAPADTAAAPAAVEAPADTAPAAVDAEEIGHQIVALVAEQTGYPADMLDLDLDLEADLGIDTVKQAELFATIRTTYDIPRDDTLKLRDYPTLRHVLGFVTDRTTTISGTTTPATETEPTETAAAPADTAAAPAAVEAPADTAPAAVDAEEIGRQIVALVAEQTGYPADMLDLDLDLEADLGIDTVKQAELFATIRTTYDIPRDDTLKLRDYPTLRHVLGFVTDRTTTISGTTTPTTETQPTETAAAPAPAQNVSASTVPETATPHAETAAVDAEEIGHQIVALVAEQTGYPADMLDLDLDLEADLGIDTVKQAELFATIRTTYDIPRDDTLKLRDYPTLRHVLGFVTDRTPTTSGTTTPTTETQRAETAAPAPAPAPADTAPGAVDAEEVGHQIVALVAEQTGYPADMLDLDLDLEADLGIDTVKQAELFATIRTTYDIPRDDTLKLRDYPTLRHVLGFVTDRTPTTSGTTTPTTETEPTETAAAPAPAQDVSASTVPETATPHAETAAVDAEEIGHQIVALVAEQTGYPADMLDLDLDLEADLGIDTVKQAELFATIRTTYDIPRDDTLKLRDYPTLRHVLGFVTDRTPTPTDSGTTTPTTETEPTETAVTAPAATVAADAVEVPEVEGYPRRVPVPVLRPPLSCCVPTEVRLDGGSRVVVALDGHGVGHAVVGRLRALGADVFVLDGAPPAEELEQQLADWRGERPVTGVVWLPALDDEGPLLQLDHWSWKEGLRHRVKLLATAMRALYEDVSHAGAFLVSATRQGGRHGYDESGARSTMAGAVSGFTKAFARERSAALVKVLDVEERATPDEVAEALFGELGADPGVVEVGHAGGERWSVGLRDEPAFTDPALVLGPSSVFVVTGAAGSIVSAITTDLASVSGGTFHLLDLTPEPDPGDPDLAQFANDRDGLKRVLAERMKERGDRPTPALIERELAGIERRVAARAAIEAVRAAGGTPYWYQVDLTDGDAVAAALATVRERSGRADVLLHCAGLEISRFLPDKSPREYDLVFDVKADGWFHLLKGWGDTELGAAVVFSSIAGRFGNGGQTDYSAANDLLCKSVSSFRSGRPGTRGIAIDWTAWASIGMASRGSIPKMMELAGIDMLPPEVGVPAVRREITATRPSEVVVAGRLGMLLDERHATGGLDPERATDALLRDAGPMAGRVAGWGLGTGMVVRTVLDPEAEGFLHDHRIDGIPVLPGVMGIESFAEAAAAAAPGWHVVAVEDVAFLAPFKCYRDAPREAEIRVQLRPVGDQLLADAVLIGRRTLPGQGEQETVHFRGAVRLDRQAPAARHGTAPGDPVRPVVADDIYRIYFHGPAYQVLEQAWRGDATVTGRFAHDLPANHGDGTRHTLVAPRLVELVFQTAGVWQLGTSGVMALPTRVRRLDLCADVAPQGPWHAVVRASGDAWDADVCDATGAVRLSLSGYETVALPVAPDPAALAPLRRAME